VRISTYLCSIADRFFWQNDIIGILDSSGNQVVSYVYDTWGKLISTTGALSSTVGIKNFYRYRGYRYDNETGLYSLLSRYYDPNTGRFLNADGEFGQVGSLLGHNVFTYCSNNPVNMKDPSGRRQVVGDNNDRGAALAEGLKATAAAAQVTAQNNKSSATGTVSKSSSGSAIISIVKTAAIGAGDALIANGLSKVPVVIEEAMPCAMTKYSTNYFALYGASVAKVGVLACLSLGFDYYIDNQNYNGWDLNYAKGLDTAGFLAALGIGLWIASQCTPIGWGLDVAIGLTILSSMAISGTVGLVKTNYLHKKYD
jgi:RHS repeat-associated protein